MLELNINIKGEDFLDVICLLGKVKNELKRYKTSGEYKQEVQRIFQKGYKYEIKEIG